MSGLFLGVIISFAILLFGIGGLIFLVKRYHESLLANFNQKMAMTFGLLLIFGSFYIMALFMLPKLKHFFWFQDPWFLIRFGLAFFILNAFLILACRSLIKHIFNSR